jgi:hypothetical protein
MKRKISSPCREWNTRTPVVQPMAAKLTSLTHKIAIQLHLVAESPVLAPGGQSGNFWYTFVYMELFLLIVMTLYSLQGTEENICT